MSVFEVSSSIQGSGQGGGGSGTQEAGGRRSGEYAACRWSPDDDRDRVAIGLGLGRGSASSSGFAGGRGGQRRSGSYSNRQQHPHHTQQQQKNKPPMESKALVERPPAVQAMMEAVSQPSRVVRVLARGEKLD